MLKGVENYDAIIRIIKSLAYLVESNAVDSNITTILASLMDSFNRSQFSRRHLSGSKLAIYSHNHQNYLKKGFQHFF